MVWVERVEGSGIYLRRGEVVRFWREFFVGFVVDFLGLLKCFFIGEGFGGIMRGCRGVGFLGF